MVTTYWIYHRTQRELYPNERGTCWRLANGFGYSRSTERDDTAVYALAGVLAGLTVHRSLKDCEERNWTVETCDSFILSLADQDRLVSNSDLSVTSDFLIVLLPGRHVLFIQTACVFVQV